MIRSVLAGSAAVLLATSCGSGKLPGTAAGLDGARDTAAAWYGAVADNDADTACQLMTTSMRAKVIGDAQAVTCEDGIRRHIATLDEPTKQQMKSKDFRLTPEGRDFVYVRLNGSWRAPTFQESWIDGRWWVSGIDE